MKCAACKSGDLKQGTVAIPYVQANATILVKDVEAMVCEQCGAWYINPETLEKVRKLIEQETKSGHEVSVVSMKKAA